MMLGDSAQFNSTASILQYSAKHCIRPWESKIKSSMSLTLKLLNNKQETQAFKIMALKIDISRIQKDTKEEVTLPEWVNKGSTEPYKKIDLSPAVNTSHPSAPAGPIRRATIQKTHEVFEEVL